MPWDWRSYWELIIWADWMDTVPLVGDYMKGPMLKYFSVGKNFALHIYLLPALIVGFIAIHIILFRRFGMSGQGMMTLFFPGVIPDVRRKTKKKETGNTGDEADNAEMGADSSGLTASDDAVDVGSVAAQDSASAKPSGKKFFPHHVLILSVLMAFVLVFVGYMAQTYPIPDDAPMEIPFPDDGEDIPGPEWLFLLFWIPFWYFKGRLKKYLFLTSVVPIVIVIFLIFLPYFHKLPLDRIPGLKGILSKVRGRKTGPCKKLCLCTVSPSYFSLW